MRPLSVERVKNWYHWKRHLRHEGHDHAHQEEASTEDTRVEIEKVRREKKP